MRDIDDRLCARIRPMMNRRKGCTEQEMFGGVCFMIHGNMAIGTWQGSLVVRLDKEKDDETQGEPHVRPMDITGKVMRGWALVEPAGIELDADLKSWLDRAVRYARTLPQK